MGECPNCGSDEFATDQLYPFREDYYRCTCEVCEETWNTSIDGDNT